MQINKNFAKSTSELIRQAVLITYGFRCEIVEIGPGHAIGVTETIEYLENNTYKNNTYKCYVVFRVEYEAQQSSVFKDNNLVFLSKLRCKSCRLDQIDITINLLRLHPEVLETSREFFYGCK